MQTKKRGKYSNNLSAVGLNRKFARQQNVFVKDDLAQESYILFSFMVAYQTLANHSVMVIFLKCMLNVADQVCTQ